MLDIYTLFKIQTLKKVKGFVKRPFLLYLCLKQLNMNDVIFLENQIIIMEALLCINTVENETKKKLREQIIFTRARIRAFS